MDNCSKKAFDIPKADNFEGNWGGVDGRFFGHSIYLEGVIPMEVKLALVFNMIGVVTAAVLFFQQMGAA